MEIPPKDIISEEEKERYISALTPELPSLRLKAGISQEELAMLIGVSRQTLGVIERHERGMSWNIFLALIFVFASDPIGGLLCHCLFLMVQFTNGYSLFSITMYKTVPSMAPE